MVREIYRVCDYIKQPIYVEYPNNIECNFLGGSYLNKIYTEFSAEVSIMVYINLWYKSILYFLYSNKVITLNEAQKLKDMINSPDEETVVVGFTIMSKKYDDYYFSIHT